MKNHKTKGSSFSKTSIESYLKGKSDKETTRAIEEEMNNSLFFSDAMDGFSEAPEFLDRVDKLSFDSIRTQKKPSKTYSLYRIAAAAAVLLLPLVAILWWPSQNTDDNLFAHNFSSFPTDKYETTRSEETSAKVLTKEMTAYKAYAEKDYTTAIQAFKNYIALIPEDAEATFYLGLAQLETGQAENAINNLETARINSDRFYEDATWYLALAHIKLNQRDDAGLVLQDLIKNEQGHYFAKAKKLLEDLQ